ncbi:hypothetical protein D3C81_1975440 [compost metagenome]
MAAVAGVTRRLWWQTDELVVFQIAQLDVDAQQVGGDFRAFAQNHCALDRVLQLTYVTRPGIMTDRLFGIRGKLQVGTVDACALTSEEGSSDFVDVSAALAQGR